MSSRAASSAARPTRCGRAAAPLSPACLRAAPSSLNQPSCCCCCAAPPQVSYKKELGDCLGLEIPVEAATNRAALDDFREREQKRQKLKEQGAAAAKV